MSSSNEIRQLTAILFTDIVGYTRMMGEKEEPVSLLRKSIEEDMLFIYKNYYIHRSIDFEPVRDYELFQKLFSGNS